MERSHLRLAVPGAAGLVTVAAMIATPLAARGGTARRRLAPVVVGGLAVSALDAAIRRWGARRAASAAASVGVGTWAVELAGSTTGVPFGRYAYTGVLRPRVGGVPLVVPGAWWAMALPAREAAHQALGSASTPARRVALGAIALTAWDLFLDPQMVAEGYWRWASPGRYRTVPWTNFAGWIATAAAVMAVLERALPPGADGPPPDARRAEVALSSTYACMAVMETLGFAVWFRDRLVAAVGGAAMLPVAGLATARLVRARRAVAGRHRG